MLWNHVCDEDGGGEEADREKWCVLKDSKMEADFAIAICIE